MSVREHNRNDPIGGICFRIGLAEILDHLPVGKIGQQKPPPPLAGNFCALDLPGMKLGEFHQEGLRSRRGVR
jgi:hypothetical protein